MSLEIKTISFEEILPVWRDKLWAGRQSKIEPVSAIDEDGSINMEIMNAHPIFFGCYENTDLLGVVSGFKTGAAKYRSRGLWVSESLRGKGVGRNLINELFNRALKENCSSMWTMARHDAWPFYQKVGFTKKFETNIYEFGPHIICEKKQ